MKNIRQATTKDLSRIAEMIVFNYRLNFYPIFQDDEFYFNEMQVANLVDVYRESVGSMWVYDDGAVKGVIQIENQEIKKLFVEPALQGKSIGSALLEYAINKYVVIPVFKSKELNGEYVSKLNPFSTIWCVIENIFLAATAEGLACSMRIPLNEEHDVVKARLKVPPTYMIPVFIGIGYADPNEMKLEQNVANLDKQLHFGRWK